MRLKYVGNDVDRGDMALVFEKRIKYVGIDLDIYGNGKNIWEMT